MYYQVLVGDKSFHGTGPLTYSSTDSLQIGQVVEVRVKSKTCNGFVSDKLKVKPSYRTSEVIRSFKYRVPKSQIRLLAWLTDYYPGPIGAATDMFLSSSDLSKAKPIVSKSIPHKSLPNLNSQQKSALKIMLDKPYSPILLHGDTGTGKTRLYIERTLQVLAQGRSVLVLTPEIGLTELLKERFARAIPAERIHIWHSARSVASRRDMWAHLSTNESPVVLIGARSAMFAPLSNIGLVILDEAHDSAYKQEQTPYYQSTRVAGAMAKLNKCQLIFGSATPLITDYYMFQQKDLPIIRLDETAIRSNHKIDCQIVDMSDKSQFSKSNNLSSKIIESVATALSNKEQSMLFLNRRGSARLVKCSDCGWQARCQRCDIALTYHSDKHRMLCHSCNYYEQAPNLCPDCLSSNLIYTVAGTKMIESEVNRLFPNANVCRFDKDTSANNKINKVYDDLQSGNIDIIIGTQSIVKGFDLPKLSVVGVVHADSGMQLADFSSTEKTYQLINQVAGRIGRGYREGTLLIQTYNPESQLIDWALKKDYKSFYESELKHRQQFIFPPACYLLKIGAKRASANSARESLNKVANMNFSQVQILGPAPAYPEKTSGKYCWQLVVKSSQRRILVDIARSLPNNFSYNLDPAHLL